MSFTICSCACCRFWCGVSLFHDQCLNNNHYITEPYHNPNTRGAGAMAPKPPWLTQNFAQWRQDRTWLIQVFRSHWLKWQRCFQVKIVRSIDRNTTVNDFMATSPHIFNRLLLYWLTEWYRDSFWRILNMPSSSTPEVGDVIVDVELLLCVCFVILLRNFNM